MKTPVGPTVLCESPAEVLFREICKYFRSTYFVDHFETAASENEIIKSNRTVKNLLKICFFWYRRAGFLGTFNIYSIRL